MRFAPFLAGASALLVLGSQPASVSAQDGYLLKPLAGRDLVEMASRLLG